MPKNKPEARPFPWPLVMVGVGVLLIVIVLGMGVVYNSPRPTPTATSLVLAGIERVSLEDAYRAFQDNEALFLDVRDEFSYTAGHVPGALQIESDQLTGRLGDLDPNTWIITYCT